MMIENLYQNVTLKTLRISKINTINLSYKSRVSNFINLKQATHTYNKSSKSMLYGVIVSV